MRLGSRFWKAVALPVLAFAIFSTPAARAQGGTDANGFFTEYLTAIGYNSPGCDAGGDPATRAADYLCDGDNSEDSILPYDGLVLGPPVLDAGDCTGSDEPAVARGTGGFHANALLDLFQTLPIATQLVGGAEADLLDLDALSGDSTNAVAYAWIYVINETGTTLDLNMGIGSDDSVTVEVNRVQVTDFVHCAGYDVAGVVQHRFPISLHPGGNLIQFKCFEGSGGWGFRARLEDRFECPPNSKRSIEPVLGDDPRITIVLPQTPAEIPAIIEAPESTRTIATAGVRPAQVTATITVTVDNAAQAYDLEEAFDEDWEFLNPNPAASATGAGFARWTGITEGTVTYQLRRSGDWGADENGVAGNFTLGGITFPVQGENAIPGGIPLFVSDVLVSAALNIADTVDGDGNPVSIEGCTVTSDMISGDWISGTLDDGVTLVTDATIRPEEGLVVRPDFLGASQSDGLSFLGATAEVNFWETLGLASGGFIINRAQSADDGLFDWQRTDIYEIDVNDAMNVAWFYVESSVQRDVVMGFGSDDAGGVRMNGDVVHAMPACRGDPGFADKFRARLYPGKNLVSFYTFENTGGFEARIRFEDEDGNPLAVKTTVDPSGYVPGAHPPQPNFAGLGQNWLASAPYEFLGGRDGCTVTTADMQGDWISGEDGDGNPITDGTIIPAVGMVLFPDSGGAAPLTGGLKDIERQDAWWTIPGDQLNSGGIINEVPAPGGVVDWDAAGVYSALGNVNDDPELAMNVAWFYAVNDGPTRCLWGGFGSDDYGSVRVNGRPVFENFNCAPVNSFAGKFQIQLDPGKNLISIYTYENGGNWDVTFRFEDPVNNPVDIPITTDPSGYVPGPEAHPDPAEDCFGPIPPAAYVRDGGLANGLVTEYLVNALPLEQGLGAGTIAGALPEDYITGSDGGAPAPGDIREGAIVREGSTLAITTGVRGGCDFTQLVRYSGFVDGDPTDPSLFDGEAFYGGAPDNYSTTGFFYINNKTGGDLQAWFGFASDDGATVFVNGALVTEYVPGRGYGAAHELQTFADQAALLEAGDNLVQISYNEGGGGSGFRIGFYMDECFSEAFPEDMVEVSANPPGLQPSTTGSRTLTPISCDGTGTATITLSVPGGGPSMVEVIEELPAGVTGSNPSDGSFDAGGAVLTFNGMASDGMQITYDFAGAQPGLSFCLGSVEGNAILGDNVFVEGSGVCVDQDVLEESGYFINCGYNQVIDNSGRVWLEDTLANPSKHLVSPNANTADWLGDWGPLTPPDTTSDPLVADRQYPPEVFPSERWMDGDVVYRFDDLPLGCYEVVLLFMEGCCSDGCVSDGTLPCDAVRVPQDGQPPLVDPADGVVSAGGCRVFDILLNGELVADQFSQNSLAACLAGTAPGVSSNGVAVTQQFFLNNVDSIEITIQDLGGGNPPENSSIKGIAIKKLTPDDDEFENCEEIPTGGLVRGDADSSGRINLTDGVKILNWLFLGGPEPECLDASDTDDTGSINLTDAVRIFNWLFTGGPPPVAPSPSVAEYAAQDCGTDDTLDADGQDLGCAQKSAKCDV